VDDEEVGHGGLALLEVKADGAAAGVVVVAGAGGVAAGDDQIDGDVVGHAAGAADDDGEIGFAFDHGIEGGGEGKDAGGVIVLDDHDGGVVGAEGGAAGGVEE